MGLPKYDLLKQELVRLIDDGSVGEDEPIPSERELCERYSLSRITVRKAIDELVVEGLLYRVHGKGTYVKKIEASQDLFFIDSCSSDIEKAHMTPSRKTIFQGIVDAYPKRMKELELSPNEKLFKLDRVYYADLNPVNRTITYLPIKYFPGIDKYDFSKYSLYEILETKYNVKITRAKRTLEAVLSYGDTTKLLQINNNTPIILFRAVTYGIINEREVAIESFKSSYRTDKIKFHINQIR